MAGYKNYYLCHYELVYKDGTLAKWYNTVCFRQAHNTLCKRKIKEVIVYVLKEQNYYDYLRQNPPLTEVELRTYFQLLAECGFKIKTEEVTVALPDPSKLVDNSPQTRDFETFKVTIDVENRSTNENLIVLNLVRHGYESKYIPSVQLFLDWASRKNKSVTLLERLIMSLADISVGKADGHTCIPMLRLPLLESDKLKAEIFDATKGETNQVASKFPATTKQLEFQKAKQLFEEIKTAKTLTEKKKRYIEICKEYT